MQSHVISTVARSGKSAEREAAEGVAGERALGLVSTTGKEAAGQRIRMQRRERTRTANGEASKWPSMDAREEEAMAEARSNSGRTASTLHGQDAAQKHA